MTDVLAIKKRTEEYVLEYVKCKNDFGYFCSNYILLELPGGDKYLKPYKSQIGLTDLITSDHYVLVLKSRQIGISTIIQAYSAWLCIFNKNAVVGIISKDGKEATDFARAIRGMIDKLPDWMKPPKGESGKGFNKRTEQSFILTNGSKVYASPVNPIEPDKTLRGKAITFLVIDEAAFIRNLDSAWTGMVAALSTNQMQARKQNIPYGTIVLSTPNKTVGVGQWFFDRYRNSVSGKDIFKPYVIHWKNIKELSEDPEWYNTQCRLYGHDNRKIQQELELKFLPAGGSFLDEKTIEILQDLNYEPIEKIRIFNGEIWKFAESIANRFYILGVDTAPEHGGDMSAITIWDYETLEQVWEYQGKCAVMDFLKIVKLAIHQYPGLLVVESNSYGNQIVENIYRSDLSQSLYKEKRGEQLIPGLSTNSKTRPLMIDALYSYVTEFPECIKSKRLILELIGLVEKSSGKVEADSGCHDDLALSSALGFYVRKYDPPLMLDSSKQQQSLFSDIINMNNDDYYSDLSNTAVMKRVKEQQSNFNSKGLNYVNTIDHLFGITKG